MNPATTDTTINNPAKPNNIFDRRIAAHCYPAGGDAGQFASVDQRVVMLQLTTQQWRHDVVAWHLRRVQHGRLVVRNYDRATGVEVHGRRQGDVVPTAKGPG